MAETYTVGERSSSRLASFGGVLARQVQREDADEELGMWAEADRGDREERRRENRAAWVAHEIHMGELHAALSEEHRAKAAELLGEEVC